MYLKWISIRYSGMKKLLGSFNNCIDAIKKAIGEY